MDCAAIRLTENWPRRILGRRHLAPTVSSETNDVSGARSAHHEESPAITVGLPGDIVCTIAAYGPDSTLAIKLVVSGLSDRASPSAAVPQVVTHAVDVRREPTVPPTLRSCAHIGEGDRLLRPHHRLSPSRDDFR